MTDKIDMQAQQPGENSKAYLGYTTYRDMGESRTVQGAYNIYLVTIGKEGATESNEGVNKSNESASESKKVLKTPSNGFRAWSVEFSWDDRVKDYTDQTKARIQAALLESDQQTYLDRVEECRKIFEDTAVMQLKASQLQTSIAFNQLVKIGQIANVKKLDKKELEELALISKINKEASEVLSGAKVAFYDAMGLSESLGLLSNAED